MYDGLSCGINLQYFASEYNVHVVVHVHVHVPNFSKVHIIIMYTTYMYMYSTKVSLLTTISELESSTVKLPGGLDHEVCQVV